jgi:hypothetical protein
MILDFCRKRLILFGLMCFVINLNFIFCDFGKSTENIKMTISSEKSIIKKTEPIEIELRIESLSGKYRLYKHKIFGITAALGVDDWLSFEIISENGNKIKTYEKRVPEVKRPNKKDFVDIIPDKPYVEIVRIFPKEFLESENYEFAKWEEIGKFKVKAIYNYKSKKNWIDDPGLWQGFLESNFVEINIIDIN